MYRDDLHKIIEPAVKAVGYELWGIEFFPQGRYSLLRVYIELEGGIGIEDCAKTSRQISAVLDVEDPISEEYTLEVSSPGIERPLFLPTHYQRYIGQKAKVDVYEKLANKRKITGVIKFADDENVGIDSDDEVLTIPFSNLMKGHLLISDEMLTREQRGT